MHSFNHLVEVFLYILLLYLSGDVESYILELERSVGTFDIGGLWSSPKLRCKTWHKVFYCLCSFSRLRHTLRGLCSWSNVLNRACWVGSEE